MTDVQKTAASGSFLEEPKKRPETLNVISILTFIGSGITILTQFVSFFRAQSNYDQMVQNQDKMEQAPDFLKRLMGPDPVGMARKTLENRTPMLILGIVGAVLCIYGAVQMRKLKKIGFPIYVIGELLPFVVSFIFIGQMPIFGLVFALLINVAFIIMYATQLKYLS
ncbi:MAG TPA: hypothetical protein VL727_00295 [Puia sp.]|jgi:hypothetical protein|nr:hypothetical protein [Puia sp.]